MQSNDGEGAEGGTGGQKLQLQMVPAPEHFAEP